MKSWHATAQSKRETETGATRRWWSHARNRFVVDIERRIEDLDADGEVVNERTIWREGE